jgi:autotransporter-associated beta strand protein
VTYGGGGSYADFGITGTARLGADDGLATNATADFGVSGNGLLDLAGYNQSLVGITRNPSGSATIGNSSTTADSTLTLTGSSSFPGVIQDVVGSGARKVNLTMNGTGETTTLAGPNTYTGTTTVAAGVLAVTGSLGNTAVAVGNGGTLQGSGTIAGEIAVQNGGAFAPGTSIESLGAGGLDLQAGSLLDYEINRDAAPAAAGDLAYLGAGSIAIANGARLAITDLGSTGTWTPGTRLTLVAYTSATAWSGGLFDYYVGDTLAIPGLANGGTISGLGGLDWIFRYDDTTAGDNFTSDLGAENRFMTLEAIPEPGTAALAALAGLALLARRRRA